MREATEKVVTISSTRVNTGFNLNTGFANPAVQNLSTRLEGPHLTTAAKQTPAKEETRAAPAFPVMPKARQEQGSKKGKDKVSRKPSKAEKFVKKIAATKRELAANQAQQDTITRAGAAEAASVVVASSSLLPARRDLEGSSSSTSSSSTKTKTTNTTVTNLTIKTEVEDKPSSTQGRKRSASQETKEEKVEKMKRREETNKKMKEEKKKVEKEKKDREIAGIRATAEAEEAAADALLKEAYDKIAELGPKHPSSIPVLMQISRLIEKEENRKAKVEEDIKRIKNAEEIEAPVFDLDSTAKDLNESDPAQTRTQGSTRQGRQGQKKQKRKST